MPGREKQAGQMGKTENRLIIHQYSKPGAVPVGGCSMEMLWHAVICFFSA